MLTAHPESQMRSNVSDKLCTFGHGSPCRVARSDIDDDDVGDISTSLVSILVLSLDLSLPALLGELVGDAGLFSSKKYTTSEASRLLKLRGTCRGVSWKC